MNRGTDLQQDTRALREQGIPKSIAKTVLPPTSKQITRTQKDMRAHDREYYNFEFENMCPICYEENLWWKFEHGDTQAGEILEKSGRLSDGSDNL